MSTYKSGLPLSNLSAKDVGMADHALRSDLHAVLKRGCERLRKPKQTVLFHRPYSMTATVTQDAELGFWNSEALDALLRKRPELCQPLLVLLSQRMAENDALHKAFLTNDAPPAQQASLV